MATPQVGETDAYPALPFAQNETLQILTYDFCAVLSAKVDDILPYVEFDDIPDPVRRALEWGEDGEAHKEWKEKLRYVINMSPRSADIYLLLDTGEGKHTTSPTIGENLRSTN